MIFTALSAITTYWKYIAGLICVAAIAFFIYSYKEMKEEIDTLHTVVNSQDAAIKNIEAQYQINSDAILKYVSSVADISSSTSKHKEKVYNITNDTSVDAVNTILDEALSRLEGASSK